MKKIFLILLSFACLVQTYSQISQWRGENRDGIYNETGLLKQWPEDGPKLLWHYDELGAGHSSASVTDDCIYVSGTTSDQNGFVLALDQNGNKLWQTEIGQEWFVDWEGVRSSPLVYNDKVYMLSSFGKLFCLNAETGEIIWNVDLFTTYEAENIKWGLTENLLIDDGKLFVTLGGKDENVIALNKDDGKLIWKSKGNGELSAYCSPMIIKISDIKILVTQTQSSILGIDASDGTLLWKHDYTNKWSVMANTPVYKDGFLYCFSGYGKGGVMLKLSDDGKSITEQWVDDNLDNQMGGVVVLNNRIYGAGQNNAKWFCLDWITGKVLYSDNFIKVGTIISAEGLLYCYGQDGKIALVEPKDDSFNVISTFDVPYGEKYHWAHLVIHDKKLYVRHGTSLMVYDISNE